MKVNAEEELTTDTTTLLKEFIAECTGSDERQAGRKMQMCQEYGLVNIEAIAQRTASVLKDADQETGDILKNKETVLKDTLWLGNFLMNTKILNNSEEEEKLTTEVGETLELLREEATNGNQFKREEGYRISEFMIEVLSRLQSKINEFLSKYGKLDTQKNDVNDDQMSSIIPEQQVSGENSNTNDETNTEEKKRKKEN